MKTLAALKQLRLGSTDCLIAPAHRSNDLSVMSQPQSISNKSIRPAFTRTNRGYEDCKSLGGMVA